MYQAIINTNLHYHLHSPFFFRPLALALLEKVALFIHYIA